MPLNPKPLPQLAAPAVSRMKQYAAQHAPAGRKLVSLLRGEPDFATPQYISDALWSALQAGYTHYPPIQGYPELRQAIASRLHADYGIAVDPDASVLVTSGATAGMYLALQATVSPGDEVLLPQPLYDAYHNQIKSVGGVPVAVAPARREGRFSLDFDALHAARTPRTRLLILNTPWNPTGTVLSRDELLDVAAFALQHDLLVIVDEIYEKLLYDGAVHLPLAALSPDLADRLITINSFSKTYAMTGWRLGYNLAGKVLTAAMLAYYRQFSRGAAAFVQQAGIAALQGPQTCVHDMVAAYQQRRDLMLRLSRAIDDVQPLAPQGGLFCLLDVRAFGRPSEELAQALVRDWGLLTVPGAYYGPALEGVLRLSFSYAPPDIERGLQRLAEALPALRA